ncbi:hypothetical protein ACKI14_45130 [Streptomyces turgidiscabies]|uniref:hypothetical protein n=1 Tax=Streptomyces turgidiscabies TaxID=85558 RepID=UPI0038F7B885
MAAADTAPSVLTAHIRAGFHPEDAFTGARLDPPTGAGSWLAEGAYRYRLWLAVDLRTGEVWYGDTDYHRPDEQLLDQLPGPLRPENMRTASGVMVRLVSPLDYHDADTPAVRPFTAEELYAVATAVLPIVQRLVDTLHRVGPREELEWSAAALSAWRDFERATEPTFSQGTPVWPEPVVAPVRDCWREAADFMALHPQLIPAAWATASDAELERIAAYEPQGGGYGGVAGLMSTDDEEIYEEGWGGTTIVGDRAALYAYRAKAAGDRAPADADAWLGTEAGTVAYATATETYGALADQDDVALVRLADRLQAAATAEGLALYGLVEQLQHRRAAERRAVEDLLRRQGEDVAALERRLDTARKLRRPTLVRVLGWSTRRPDRELGELASMSHTSVGDVRRALEAADHHEDQEQPGA